MNFFDQSEYNIRCEWGEEGVKALAPISDVVIIVDILSFSTSVDLIVSKGGTAYPYRWNDDSAGDYARSVDAELAGPQNPNGFSLAPTTLENIPENLSIVLPSPNGSTITLLAQESIVLAGCLRNCRAVAETAMGFGKNIAVVPCGERWSQNNSLRPGLEDFIGAGAAIRFLEGSRSPESEAALTTFTSFEDSLFGTISRCGSGKEKLSKNKERDVFLASQFNVSHYAPRLIDGAYRANPE